MTRRIRSTSDQEENLFALAALQKIGEVTLPRLASEMGVASCGHTVERLIAQGRVTGRWSWNATFRRRQYLVKIKGRIEEVHYAA